MRKPPLEVTCIFLLLMGLVGCSRSPDAGSSPKIATTNQPLVDAPADAGLGRLFGRVWRISKAPVAPPYGSIYVFQPNGTLLETSCVETYRIATWAADPREPGVLRVVEDGRPAFSAKVGESTEKTLRLQQTMLLGNKETRELTLTAVDQEFVCPDLPK